MIIIGLRLDTTKKTASVLIHASFKENFANHSDVKFAQEYRLKNVKKEDSVGFDLCVLASSDHALITYGSFGLWGAILSRGDVIAAKGTNNKTYSVVTVLCINILNTFNFFLA